MSTSRSLEYGLETFRRLGLSDEAFYGAAGSLMGESGRQLDTGAHNPRDPNGGSKGIAQWHSDRWWDFQAAVATPEWGRGRNENDYTAQWDWIAHELQTSERATYERLMSVTDRAEAAKIWTDSYERPAASGRNYEGRIENANYAADVVSGRIQPDRDGSASFTGANTSYSTSNATDGIDPMANPWDFLLGLGSQALSDQYGSGANGIQTPGVGTSSASSASGTGNGSRIPESRGPINATQALAMAMGNYVHGEDGARFAASLFGAGNEPKKLTMTEGITMGIGGYLGGLPGAVLGQALGRSIAGLFDGDGNAMTLNGEGTFGFGGGDEEADQSGGGGGGLLRGLGSAVSGLFDGDGNMFTNNGKRTLGLNAGGNDTQRRAATSDSGSSRGPVTKPGSVSIGSSAQKSATRSSGAAKQR